MQFQSLALYIGSGSLESPHVFVAGTLVTESLPNSLSHLFPVYLIDDSGPQPKPNLSHFILRAYPNYILSADLLIFWLWPLECTP